MTEQDDLFEFGDFEDDQSLDLDLNDLFGDLEVLSLDPGAAAPVAGAAPAPAAAAAPVAAAPAAQVAPAAEAPQSIPAQAAPVQPVAGQIPVAQPAMMPYVMAAPPAPTSNKATIAIAIAALVTLANVAVIAAPMFSGSQQAAPQQDIVEVATSAENDSLLLQRIDDLETQLQGINTTQDAPRMIGNEGDRHRAFDAIDNNIELGQFVEARQRLYSLLAIIDRFPTHQRDRYEELASFTLADTYRLEALRAEQEETL